MLNQQQVIPDIPQTAGCSQLIVETDGSFIPMMTPAENSPDQRKRKTLHWQEIKLSLAHAKRCTELQFGVSFQCGPGASGQQWLRCALQAGLGRETQVHGVGDGAVWIIHQMEEQFGAQGTYLVDLYHTCDYLTAAAPTCSPTQPDLWREQQKQRLKQSQADQVLQELAAHCEPEAVPDTEAPVRIAHRYLSNSEGSVRLSTSISAGTADRVGGK